MFDDLNLWIVNITTSDSIFYNFLSTGILVIRIHVKSE